MKNLLSILACALVIVLCSCNNSEFNTTIEKSKPIKSFIEHGLFFENGLPLDISYIIGEFEPGHVYDMTNGWLVYIDPAIVSGPPYPTFYFCDLEYQGSVVSGPNGETYIDCPSEGTNCGEVWWQDPFQLDYEYIGLYLDPAA
ncbi:MAG: hypothetical protein H8E98_07845 [Bacteroidetes bacterium]|nr:hypothetical protein [Bacteroidota bacterium]